MKKLLCVLLMLSILGTLTGCANFQYTHELRDQLVDACEEGSKKWISTIDGAQLERTELIETFGEVTDGMTGEFQKDGTNYSFLYLSATDEFFTDMYLREILSPITEEVKTELGLDNQFCQADCSYKVSYQLNYISDQNLNRKREELRIYTVEREYMGTAYPLTDQQLEALQEMVYTPGSSFDTSIIIELNSSQEAEALLKDMLIAKKFPGFRFYISIEPEKLTYYTTNEEITDSYIKVSLWRNSVVDEKKVFDELIQQVEIER